MALRQGRLFGVGLDVIEEERQRVYDFGDLNAVVFDPHRLVYARGRDKDRQPSPWTTFVPS